MGWADNYIAKLQAGETIQFRPRGNSMTGKINSGQLVTVVPLGDTMPSKGDVVLCKVAGKQFLHKVTGIRAGGLYQISNNHGHVNGWTATIYGIVSSIEP